MALHTHGKTCNSDDAYLYFPVDCNESCVEIVFANNSSLHKPWQEGGNTLDVRGVSKRGGKWHSFMD